MIFCFRVTEHRNAVAGTVVFSPSPSFPRIRLVVSNCRRSTARQIAENRKACAFYQYRIGFFAENNFAAHASILTLLRASSQKFPFIKLHLLNEVDFIIAGSMPSVNCLVYTIH